MSQLALIEEVFPGKILGFTPAPSSAAEAETETAAPNGADADAYPAAPEEADD